MGNSDSKLVFKQGILRLSEPGRIPVDDSYWTNFWLLPESPEDVFSLFSPADVRRARDSSMANVETLIQALTSRLFVLRKHRSFPHPELAPARQALNCIRILTRILPFLYEAEQLEGWEDQFFWEKRRGEPAPQVKSEVLFGESKGEEKETNPRTHEHPTFIRPLGEEIIDNLIDLLFFAGFTLPADDRKKEKVTYTIWEKGVGSTVHVPATKDLENNRVEILRLLLTLSSKSLYLPAHILPVKGVRALTYITTCPDKQIVLSLLCSQLNTATNYNPANWRVPYDHVIYKDSKQILVVYSLQFLLTLLIYPPPDDTNGVPRRNYFRHFIGRLHRLQDFEYLVDGMKRALNQPLQATSSYLPGSQKSLDWAPEMIILFWETLYCNKRFRFFVIDGDAGHEFMTLMLFYALEYRTNPAKQSIVRTSVFVLQTMSTEVNFRKQLNRPFEINDSLPPTIKVADFDGSHADFLIISIHTLITTGKGKIDAIYPSLMATINNIAPYVEQLGAQATTKILQLFASMSSPSFLLANETNYSLLQSLLESINAILEHQYLNNREFVRGVFRSRKRFEALRSFTLESGQREIEQLHKRRKGATAHSPESNSPMRHSRNNSNEGLRSPGMIRSPSLGNVPEENAFAIGEDDDSDTENQTTEPSIPAQSSLSNQISRDPSVSSFDEAVPQQLRGMSDKARGKMPAGQLSFSRQSSTTSLSSHQNHPQGLASPTVGFDPTHTWIETWLPTLPLHTTLALLSSPEPPDTLPEVIDRTPQRTHYFSWTTMSLGWYESMLWGLIFTSEMVVSKGTVGVWNGTSIRLFRVERDVASGPSLMKPMGAVDAVGNRLVSGVKNLGSGTMTRVGGGTNANNVQGRIREV